MAQYESFALPLPTTQTLTGPKLYWEAPLLRLEYDFERDDGSIEWTQAVFIDVIMFEYRQNICCRADDLDAYNKVVRYTESDWLDEALQLREKFLGPSMTNAVDPSFSHWRMYFDDAGCLDVLARSFEIKPA